MDNFDELDRKGFLGLYRQMSGYIRVETELRNDEEERNFITMFGTSPDMCSYLWLLLQTQSFLLSTKARPVHLLWGLVMLKTYGSEALLLHSVRIDGMKATNRKTYRQWTWHIIHAIADLTAYVVSTYMHMCLQFTLLSPFFYFLISHRRSFCLCLSPPKICDKWDGRFDGVPEGEKAVCIDGIDCQRTEPAPFFQGNYSFKFNGPALRYELGTSRDGNIIHLSGPFIPGINRDDLLFKNNTFAQLKPGEICEGDAMYRKFLRDTFPGDNTEEDKKLSNRWRARHETANARIKRFKVISCKFRHDIVKHSDAFRACAVITQLEIENGKPLFD